MLTIPIITDNSVFVTRVAKAVDDGAKFFSDQMQTVSITTFSEAIDYFNMEMPDLACIDFSSGSIRPFDLLETIIGDPWLLHAGILAFCNSDQEERNLGDLKKVNIIDTIRSYRIEEVVPKIIKIIAGNRQILFQRVFGTDIPRNISAVIELENDLHAASCYANLLANFLYNTNRINREGKAGLAMAMHELLINAIEHGNCEISYDEKTALCENGGDIEQLLHTRCENPEIGNRKVTFEYTITETSSLFRISDEGAGFNWRSIPDPTSGENFMLSHGRGILMARTCTKRLSFNDKGNSVEFEVTHERPEPCIMPGIFMDSEQVAVSPGNIVVAEGDRSDFIFYIVSGEFEILVGSAVVSTLNEEDLFLGEMAFLLEHRRTATVRAKTAGRLIKVTKREFVEAIKKKPHYALLLARLLARRIERFNLELAVKNR